MPEFWHNKIMYKYTGKPFKGVDIDQLSPEAIETLLAWHYIIKLPETQNESNQSEPVELEIKPKPIPPSKSNSRNK